MGLRDLVEQDLGAILEDSATGFGWPISLTDPDGLTDETLVGFSDDIAQSIDPDTGELVSGRLASVALRISTLYAAGFSLPRGVADTSKKPWVVKFNDINGRPHVFIVRQANPDRAAGLVVCILEGYDE
jgi:hypothetical protein